MKHINTKTEILFGDRFFKSECLPQSGYDWRVHKKELSPYFEQHGFSVSMMYNDFYSRLSGIVSDRYISMDLYYFYIVPCLNRRQFSKAYADKNMYSILFGGCNQPLTVIKNRNGIFFDDKENIIDQNEAIERCLSVAHDKIIKPTVDTGEGRGVALFQARNKVDALEAFSRYKKDFIVQEKISNHSDLARLNPTSCNSMRIMTYRALDGRIHHLRNKSFFRVGKDGAVMDNMGSGGGMCCVFDDGHVNDRVVHYNSMKVESFEANYGVRNFVIPNFDQALSFAERLHARLPYFDFVGWDITIDQEGNPALIEYNLPGETGSVQSGCGPMFVEDLDEIMMRLSSVRKQSAEVSMNVFQHGYEHLLQIKGDEYDFR